MKNKLIFDKISNIFSKWIPLNHYYNAIIEDIGIDIDWLNSLTSELLDLDIKIQWIDAFKNEDKNLALLDFWYNSDVWDDYSIQVKHYLALLKPSDKYLFSITLLTDNPLSIELKIFLDKIAFNLKNKPDWIIQMPIYSSR